MVRNNRSKSAGFTLVELIVVVIVITILALIITLVYTDTKTKALDAKRKEDVDKIHKAMQVWAFRSGKTYAEMNTGWSGGGATGYFHSSYGGLPSARSILMDAGYLDESVADPEGRPYFVSVCTGGASDNKRLVYARFTNAPTPSAAEVASAAGCTHASVNQAINSYRMNYAVLIDS